MPRATLEPAPQLQPELEPGPKAEPMDIQKMAAEHEMTFKPQREAEQEEHPEEEEECIMLRRLYFLHFRDTLVDIRSQIRDVRSQFVDYQSDARQDRLEVQEMFQAILGRLPPTAGPSAAPPAP
jgi:hypothetical protein